MDTIITKLSDFMSVDIILKSAVSFRPIVFITFLVLIKKDLPSIYYNKEFC